MSRSAQVEISSARVCCAGTNTISACPSLRFQALGVCTAHEGYTKGDNNHTFIHSTRHTMLEHYRQPEDIVCANAKPKDRYSTEEKLTFWQGGKSGKHMRKAETTIHRTGHRQIARHYIERLRRPARHPRLFGALTAASTVNGQRTFGDRR
jgi:hypothetical protein